MLWILLLLLGQQVFGLVALWPGVADSRRALAGALALTIPVVGLVLAIVVRRVQGSGTVTCDPPGEAKTHSLSVADVRRAGELPALLERLMSPLAEERHSALAELTTATEATAVPLLRWAVEHGCHEVVLDAALTLEELDLRRERRLEEAVKSFEDAPSFDRAVAAAEAAASGVISGLADATSAPVLADQARTYYDRAVELDPERWAEVAEHQARLELAAARPIIALEILSRLSDHVEEHVARRLRPLRDEAAFAARRFDLVSELPAIPVR